MGRQGRGLGRHRALATIAAAGLLGVSIPGCGVIVEVPPFVRGTNIQPDGSCKAGFGDCNGDTDDGCETALGTDDACSGCGDRCLNGSCAADGGAHACACAAGFAACGAEGGGCLVDLANDPAHCGSCDRDCRPGLCAKGVCQPGLVVHALQDFETIPAPFVVEGGFVYLPGVKSMVRAPVDASTEIGDAEVVFTTTRMIEALAYDGTHLARIERWDGSVTKAGVRVGSLDGRTDALIADGEDIQRVDVFSAQPIAIDGSTVYWIDGESTGEDAAPISLRSAPIDAHLAPKTALTSSGAFGSVAVSTTHVYWTDSGTVLHAHPLGDLGSHVDLPLGEALTFVSTLGPRVCTTTFDFTTTRAVHFLCGTGDDVASFAEIGGAASGQVGALVFDARRLYYTDILGAQLVGIDETSKHAAPIAPTVGWAGGIVLHDGDIYWRAYNGVWRLRHANDAPP